MENLLAAAENERTVDLNPRATPRLKGDGEAGGKNPMGKMMIAVIALLGLSQAAWADDFSLNAPTLDAAHLPKKGIASYEGTWATTDAWAGVSGLVQLVVDFGTGDVSADLTIPWLGTDSNASVARR